MKSGNLIKCTDPPPPLSDETLGVIVTAEGATVTVRWPNGQVKTHKRRCVVWFEETLNIDRKHDTIA